MIDKIRDYVKKEFDFLDEEGQKNLVETAINTLKEEKNNLINSLQTDNKNNILKNAHGLKGTLLNSGLFELAEEFNEERLKKFELIELKNILRQSLEKIVLN